MCLTFLHIYITLVKDKRGIFPSYKGDMKMENYYYTEKKSNASTVLGIISLVTGILSLLCTCIIPCVGTVVSAIPGIGVILGLLIQVLPPILAIVGLILGIVGMKAGSEGKGMNIAGIVLSVITIVLYIIVIVAFVGCAASCVGCAACAAVESSSSSMNVVPY